MLKRILTAVVALIVLIPVLWFSDTVVFPIAVALLCLIACYELLKCVGQLDNYALSVPIFVFAAALPVLARIQNFDFINRQLVLPLFLLLFCYVTVCSVICNKKCDVSRTGFVFYEIFMIIAGFTLLVTVRDMRPHTYLIIFVAAWMTDTFAYFTGYCLGKHKLCPDISPKKTVEGAVGGVVGAVVGAIVLAVVVNAVGTETITVWEAAVIAIPLSVIGQFGDLAASLTKRYFGIKDYGNLFPGHGGVLDRFDSILPITIMVYIITVITV